MTPPATLGEAGRKAWLLIQDEYKITDSGGLTVLAQIAAAHDRLAECAEIIATKARSFERRRRRKSTRFCGENSAAAVL
jgi:hypothetical protein